MRFEDYVEQRAQPLLRLAYVLTAGDGQLAEDLTQAVLTDAYRHWRKVAAARQPDAYMRRMLVNAHLSWRRRRSATEQPIGLVPDGPALAPDMAEAVASRDELRRALSTLAPRARTVLVLRYYADLTDDAIADAMGIGPSAVRAYAARALASLRDGGLIRHAKETS